MLALISPFSSLIDSLPTNWTQLLDRPQPATPSTAEVIALSLTPAKIALAALEKFSQPEATEPEPYKPETLPDYWLMEVELNPVQQSKTEAKTQLCLPAAKDEEKPEPTPEPVKVKQAIATPKMQPDGETPDLVDYFHVMGANGWFNVQPHGEGHVVQRWNKTKRQGWKHSTHLISQHGCDCEQAKKKPSSVCCHQKALGSYELAQRNQAIAAQWQKEQDAKRTKFSAEMKAIEEQRAKDEEVKLSGMIRSEAKEGKRPTAIGLAPQLTYAEQRSRALQNAQVLIMECSFNRHTGEAFLTDRYNKTKIQAMELDELLDLIEHLSVHKRSIKKANLKDVPLAQSGLKEGDLCQGMKTGYQYRIKSLRDDGFAIVSTLVGNFEATLPIDKLTAV